MTHQAGWPESFDLQLTKIIVYGLGAEDAYNGRRKQPKVAFLKKYKENGLAVWESYCSGYDSNKKFWDEAKQSG